MERRKFLQSTAVLSGASLLATSEVKAFGRRALPIIKPKKLNKGDTIGLITPASALTRAAFEKAIENLEGFGFKVKYSENMRVRKGFLAGTDKQRLQDLHTMFEDSEVSGVVCARGGYGSGRLLPNIDYNLIKRNPKVFIGYSDITALLYGIHAKTGLVCFHGPVGASSYSDFTSDQFQNVLMKGKNKVTIERPKAWDDLDDQAYKLLKINSGIASGTLVGGNLSLIVSLMGTPYDIDYTDKIVFIEDVGESPYRIDRMLTQLLNSEKLKTAKGIALGVFIDCETKPDDPDFSQSLSLREVLEDRFSNLGIPVIYGLPFGHINDNATLPFGVQAELNVDKAKLTLLENGVIS
jgi:muramoyltetrapeptide carboxypeptidase